MKSKQSATVLECDSSMHQKLRFGCGIRGTVGVVRLALRQK